MSFWLFLFLVIVPAILIIIVSVPPARRKESKRRAAILAETEKDPIFSVLINIAERRGFKIRIKATSLTGMMIFPRLKIILIFGGLLDAFAEKKLPIEAMRLMLAHELGHLGIKRTDCYLLRGPIDSCLWEELTAYKDGLNLLRGTEEQNLEKYKNVWSPPLLFQLEKQCKRCFKALLINRCPLKKETKTVNEQIEEMLKIKK